MRIDIGWSFEKALREISAVHLPWGHFGPPQRHRQIEAWGQLVGRSRALREFDQAVKRHGSLTALGREHNITIGTLRALRNFYSALPVERGGPRLARGDVLGRWHLVEQIGSGGNAEVWRARSAHRDAAIKVLRRARGISLSRFRAEIDLLKRVIDVEGVLPLVDFHCPEQIVPHERVWLGLPVAKPVREVAASSSATEIVKGISEIATTMAELHAAGISHRDLKPENLYRWNGRWAVSDLGIASFPGKAKLTAGPDKLGPVHFIAPEMLLDAANANGAAADVYSLAKTLWVLMCGQTYPPPGEHRIDVREIQVEQWVDAEGVNELNELLQACTRFSAGDRPSMAEMADVLSVWVGH